MMPRSVNNRCLLGLTVILLFLAGCAGPARVPTTDESLKQSFADQPVAETVPARADVPPEVSSALLPPLPGDHSTQAQSPGEARFDISANDTPAREFFMQLVEGTPFNMVVHPDVTGTITLSLKNTSIPEVMEIVRRVYGYPYQRSETGFQVLPAGLQSRIYAVNYLNLVRKGLSQTRVSSGQVSEKGNKNDDNENTDRDNQQEMVSGSRVDTESVSDFWHELNQALTAIIGSANGRRVVVQPQANIVVVRAMPDELNEVERYLTAIQGNLERQVILEAKILEVELNDGFQSGINWAVLAKSGSNTGVIGQIGGGQIFDKGYSEINGNSGVLNPLNPSLPEGTTTSAFGGVFSAALSFNDFSAFIEMLKSQGDVQVLSSPRISTVNNQKAVIKVGSDEFFVTDVSSDTVTGTTTTTSPDITLTPFFSGIALDVTPQIDKTGRVILHIHPTVSQVTDQTKVITVAGQEQSLPLAYSTVRESDSIVSAENGQVVVIGGLMKDQLIKDTAGVPLLSDLPGIGGLFRHVKSSSVKSELVILLRPMVVQNSRVWNAEVEQSQSRLQALGGDFRKNWY